MTFEDLLAQDSDARACAADLIYVLLDWYAYCSVGPSVDALIVGEQTFGEQLEELESRLAFAERAKQRRARLIYLEGRHDERTGLQHGCAA